MSGGDKIKKTRQEVSHAAFCLCQIECERSVCVFVCDEGKG